MFAPLVAHDETQQSNQELEQQQYTQHMQQGMSNTQQPTQNPTLPSLPSHPPSSTLTSPFLLSLRVLTTLLHALTFRAATTPKSSSRDTVSCVFYNLRRGRIPRQVGVKDKEADTYYRLLDRVRPGGRDVVKVKVRALLLA